ncbi:MAG: sulfatase [Candidatus Sumerlaeota bacterium]|nr:sulfatase [Candidatus Sumerlaeota bacterium]
MLNVVLICMDTFRADCVRAMGRKPFMKTPNLDRLAAEGALFENAFGEGQPTIQYRRALLSGMRSFPFDENYDTRGLWPNLAGWHKIPPEQPTLAELLLDAGYATGFFSDTYHMFKPTQNFTRGFLSWDFIRGQESDNYRFPRLSAIDVKRHFPPDKPPMAMTLQHLSNFRDRKTEDDYSAAKVVASALQFLDDVRDAQPFFLYVDTFDPHEPWDPPKGYADLYDPDWKEPWEPIHGVRPEDGERVCKRIEANYLGECTFVDKQVGRILDKLDQMGAAGSTLVIATSDHGTEMMDHGAISKGAHACQHRHNNEMVGIIRWPGRVPAGRRVKGFILIHDLFPTILKACGVAHPPVQGLDILPLATGATERVRDYIITGWHNLANVRTLDYSYVCNYTVGPREKEWLYDVNADPREDRDIAAQKPEICARMLGRLEGFLGQSLPFDLPANKWPTAIPWMAWLKNSEKGKQIRVR